jgi:hypothetical protein
MMKNISFIIIYLFLKIQFSYSQSFCESNLWLNFDDNYCLNNLIIDTTSNKHNIWQIGNQYKINECNNYYYNKKVIITDTVKPYPANDTSVFIIKTIASYGIIYGGRFFSGIYYVQTDSLKDYGKIEFSPDKGKTWVDIINDTLYTNVFRWYSNKPVLTGKSNMCVYFDGFFGDIGSVFDIKYGDMLLFKFSFISDSIFDNLNGLMYDNLSMGDFVEGISEIRFKPIRSDIFPNPASNVFTIKFDNPLSENFELSIYNIQSKLILKIDNIINNEIKVDAKSFKSDIYIYKLTNTQRHERSWGKFVINR